jgi:Zn-dependent metalloprotease
MHLALRFSPRRFFGLNPTSHRVSLVLLGALAALLLATLDVRAAAAFVLFREGKTPERIEGRTDYLLPADAVRTVDSSARVELNRGRVVQATYELLSRPELRPRLFIDASEFDLLGEVPTPFGAEELVFKRLHRSEKGFVLRFQQRKNRIPVVGAELLVSFDLRGRLQSLNSSLSSLKKVGSPFENAHPTISRREGLAAAIRNGGYEDPEVAPKDAGDTQAGQSDDGLLLVREPKAKGSFTLVWQFHLREHVEGRRPARIRIYASGPRAGTLQQLLPLAHSVSAPIAIYDASVTAVVPNPIYKGVHVLQNGKPTLVGRVWLSQDATDAHSAFEKTLGFYERVFGRNSYDGNGAEVVASVNTQRLGFIDLLGQRENAAWIGPWKLFVFGAGGDFLGGFAQALDVVAHEFTHAVIGSSSNLEYASESGALNEHLADVFGEMIQSDAGEATRPFLLGETVLRGRARQEAEALRDMLNPGKGLSPQPGHLAETPPEFGPSCAPNGSNDNCGVHILSGIPNRAISLAAQKVGWTALRSVLYTTMIERLRSNSDFNDYRDQIVEECRLRLGSPSQACAALSEGFKNVGL